MLDLPKPASKSPRTSATLQVGSHLIPLSHVADGWVIAREDIDTAGPAVLRVEVEGTAAHVKRVRTLAATHAGECCRFEASEPASASAA